MTGPPPPTQGGSSLHCPWQEWDQVFGAWAWCHWHRRARSAKALRLYRRHYRRCHWGRP
jgi:hypothetical protein